MKKGWAQNGPELPNRDSNFIFRALPAPNQNRIYFCREKHICIVFVPLDMILTYTVNTIFINFANQQRVLCGLRNQTPGTGQRTLGQCTESCQRPQASHSQNCKETVCYLIFQKAT